MILVCIPVLSLVPLYFIPEVGDHDGARSWQRRVTEKAGIYSIPENPVRPPSEL